MQFRGHDNPVNCLAFSPDGRYVVSGDTDNLIIVWDLEKRMMEEKLIGHEHLISDLKFTAEERWLISSS